MTLVENSTPRSVENLPSGSIAIIKRYADHNKAVKQLSQKYLDAARAKEWGEAAEYCREILQEIDKTIAEIKATPGKMSNAIFSRIICAALVMLAQTAVVLKANCVLLNYAVWQGITMPVLTDADPREPKLRCDLDSVFAIYEGATTHTDADKIANAKYFYGLTSSIVLALKIASDTRKYIKSKHNDDIETINPNEMNPIIRLIVGDLEKMKKSYTKLLAAVEAERDAQIDDAIEAFIVEYEKNMDLFSDMAAMEGATIDAIQAFRFHCKEAGKWRKQLKVARKAGKLQEAAKAAEEISKCASNIIRDIDLIPDDFLVPKLTDIAVMFLGYFISGKILEHTVGRFFSASLAKKHAKIDAKMGAGTELAENAKNAAAAKNSTRMGAVNMVAGMFMGNPLGAILNKISEKASGDKEEWGENDRNLIINALRIQAKHVRDKYAKLAAEFRSGKNPGEDKKSAAAESFTVFGFEVQEGGDGI